MAVARRPRRSKSKPGRLGQCARTLGRFLVTVLTDVDTYVLLGIGLMGIGVALAISVGAALVVAGGALFAFGIWLGFWQLSAKPKGNAE